MELPAHIASRIEAWVAATPKASFHADHEAARYGGISLLGTIGSIWLLRSDGTFWDVDDDSGKPIEPLPQHLEPTALVAGAYRHDWLRELLPTRPVRAVDCQDCSGSGKIQVGEEPSGFVYCPSCGALGWTCD